MENEFYAISVEIEVAETKHNYDKGNIYLQSQFNSFKRNQQSITLARSGYLDPKSSFVLLVKDLISFVPFSSYFFY